jgi:hypothetical protein
MIAAGTLNTTIHASREHAGKLRSGPPRAAMLSRILQRFNVFF